jgi:hypothetical protein
MVGLGMFLVWLELGDCMLDHHRQWLLSMFIGKMFDVDLMLKFL